MWFHLAFLSSFESLIMPNFLDKLIRTFVCMIRLEPYISEIILNLRIKSNFFMLVFEYSLRSHATIRSVSISYKEMQSTF